MSDKKTDPFARVLLELAVVDTIGIITGGTIILGLLLLFVGT